MAGSGALCSGVSVLEQRFPTRAHSPRCDMSSQEQVCGIRRPVHRAGKRQHFELAETLPP